jgi:hypothetical protein
VAEEGGSGVLQLEEGMRKLRDHLAKEKGHAGSSSLWEMIGGGGGSICGEGRRWPSHWHG